MVLWILICPTPGFNFRSSRPEVFLEKGVMKICSRFTGEHPCRSVILIKLQSNFIEIAFRRECSPAYLLHIFRTPFPKKTSGRLRLKFLVHKTSIGGRNWKTCLLLEVFRLPLIACFVNISKCVATASEETVDDFLWWNR